MRLASHPRLDHTTQSIVPCRQLRRVRYLHPILVFAYAVVFADTQQLFGSLYIDCNTYSLPVCLIIAWLLRCNTADHSTTTILLRTSWVTFHRLSYNFVLCNIANLFSSANQETLFSSAGCVSPCAGHGRNRHSIDITVITTAAVANHIPSAQTKIWERYLRLLIEIAIDTCRSKFVS